MKIYTVLWGFKSEVSLATTARCPRGVLWVAVAKVRVPNECISSFPGDTDDLE